MKKILIILGNTKTNGFGKAIIDTYEKSAKSAGHNVKRVNLRDLKFNPVLLEGSYRGDKLEPDLINLQKDIKWADHLVLIYPTWWMGPPAILKGLFERILTPGFAFSYSQGKKVGPITIPKKLLKGRSARIITTIGAPKLIYKFYFGAPGDKMVKKGILEFCGIKPVKIKHMCRVVSSTSKQRAKWLEEVAELGRKGS